jgi:hypothetical protein
VLGDDSVKGGRGAHGSLLVVVRVCRHGGDAVKLVACAGGRVKGQVAG